MRVRFLAVVAIAMVVWGAAAPAAPFSLYGVRMGMTRDEVGKLWAPLESGQYYIKDSVLFEVVPSFDHEDRLYQVSFSVPLVGEYPEHLTATAFQNLVTRLWGDDRAVSLSVRVGRGTGQVTVTHKARLEAFTRHIETVLAPLIRP
ncbi:MAG: hypothetical protein D6708_02415 [Candidatus Dadabacteria bacterium]|nr:MAG: hypothetical protein D6708_02415 [Candidatus Dadabacteria bacterium]